MNYTKNYQLNQWEETDRVLREDFNTDNQKIDDTLGRKCEAVFGSFVGDNSPQRKIELGFTPQAVLLLGQYPTVVRNESVYGGLALPGKPALVNRDGGVDALTITDGGFLVYYEYNNAGSRATNNGTKFYIAFR